jgi:excinuclease ABC subunit C
MTRRFARLLRERNAAPDGLPDPLASDDPQWPDLVLIDGGEGQLAAARKVLEDLGLSGLKLAGIAKGPDRDAGRERIHVAGKPSFMLDARDPVLYYIQRLRDEAHRFAIGSHRAKRTRGLSANPLDDIRGVGPGRKKALLQAFGSARSVSRASVSDLASVEGISTTLARTIYDYFHEARP